MGGLRLGEGDGATEADVEAELQELVHFIGGAAPAMHHPSGATALRLAGPQFLQHRLGGIPAVNDHRQVQLNRQVQLRAQHSKLLLEILVSEEIEAEFADGDHPIILQSCPAQHRHRVVPPMLGVQWMDADGITHLRESIRQGADRRNFGGFDAGVQQSADPSFTPT